MEEYKIVEVRNEIFPMGLTAVEGGIHFSVAVVGETCTLLLYHQGAELPCQSISFREDDKDGDVWNMTLLGMDLRKMEYSYEVDGTLFPDPYGRAFIGHEVWGMKEQPLQSLRSPIELEAFNWEGDRQLEIPFQDCIIYRIHTRGFTKHSSSKVKAKGTFLSIAEKIPYMKELGITTIELMPMVEFDEVMLSGEVNGNPYGKTEANGKLNYWGYAPSRYFAPKQSYTSSKNPVKEFKQLVKSLHQANMELMIELYFTGKESPSFVLDVARFWVREYHVDGIHLVGHAPAVWLETDPYLSRTKLLADQFGEIKKSGRKHLATYHDGFLVDMRRFLKGDEDQVNQVIFRSRANPVNHAVINYMAHTNGFTMMDMVSYDRKHNEANGEQNADGNDYNESWNCGVEGVTRKKKILELRKKQVRNALLLLFLSQGTPLLLAGDEFGNSKRGNNNSYCQDNDISWLNWNQLKTNSDIFDFTKRMIAFRKEHPVFHMEREPRVLDYLACGYPDVSYHGVKAWRPEFENFRRQLGILYCGDYGTRPDGTPDDYFFVVYNMHWEPHDFSLPNLPKKLKWKIAIRTDEKGTGELLENQKQFMVPARTIIVFVGAKSESSCS